MPGMRMVEHEFVGGLGTLSVAILMLVAALAVFIFRFLMPRHIRVPAKRMARLLDTADWCWVLLLGVVLPLALVLCLLLVNTLRCLIGKPIVRLFKTTTAIAVLPAYAIAIIALCLLMPIYHSAEKHWLARDTLTRINPEAADLGACEFKVAAQKRREINTITGIE